MSRSRPQAVLVCFACTPGGGSEEGVGWMWVRAAAAVADVTLITTRGSTARVEAAVRAAGLDVSVRSPDLPAWIRTLFRRKLIFVYYVIWQVLAGREIRRCERDGRVDVVHHLTWASDSLPSALLVSKAPIRIWGPIGGSTRTARGLYRYMTVRGKLDQAVRDVVNGTLRSVVGRRVAAHASLIVALNDDVRRRWQPGAVPVVVEPNIALDDHELADAGPRSPGRLPSSDSSAVGAGEPPALRTAVFAGRLIPWKGLLLAIRSLEYAPNWRLVVFGDGPEKKRAMRFARRNGLAARVDFRGLVPRQTLLDTFRSADAMLFPSFHDSAPWAVAEASALGCPIVCIDAGGPPLMAGINGRVVPIEPSHSLPARIGQTLESVVDRGLPNDSWGLGRLHGLLLDWYQVDPPAAFGFPAAGRIYRSSATAM